jgi:peptidoglycan/LPS O-acetylase OafA/YrhL
VTPINRPSEVRHVNADTEQLAPPALLSPRSPALTRHRPSLRALTGIRFFAALYVVLFHTRVPKLLHGLARSFFANGYLAVPLFFLLSGFILAYTYAGQIETRSLRRRFWEARFARIWPLYALSLILSSLTAFDLPRIPPLPRAVATLFMVQAWDPFNLGIAGDWNFVCWTLSCEAFFYLCFPAFQIFLERRSNRAQLLTLAATVAICLVCNTAMHSLGYHVTHGVYRFLPQALIHVPEFLIGVLLGNLHLRYIAPADPTAPSFTRRPGLLTWTAAAASIALLTLPTGRATSLVIPAFAALLFGLAAERTLLARFLSTPLLILGGGISYAMYLMQTPVKLALLRAYAILHLTGTAARLVIELLGIIAFSWLLFRFLEDPARRLLRNLFARLERRPDA